MFHISPSLGTVLYFNCSDGRVRVWHCVFFFLRYLLAALGPHCCVWFFSLVAEQGLLFPVACGLLTVAASLAGTHRPYSKRAPIVVAFELSGPVACGVFLDQGWNPRSPALAGRFFTTAPLRKSLPL